MCSGVVVNWITSLWSAAYRVDMSCYFCLIMVLQDEECYDLGRRCLCCVIVNRLIAIGGYHGMENDTLIVDIFLHNSDWLKESDIHLSK
jgi:heme/copper-type cytochrome/quinol oxidase subunit 1